MEKRLTKLTKEERRDFLKVGQEFLEKLAKINAWFKVDINFATTPEGREDAVNSFFQKRKELLEIYMAEFANLQEKYAIKFIASLPESEGSQTEDAK